jgi:Skp family chaperone for outer membrane proteins
MSQFPDIMYRVPGRHYGADGRGFDYIGVNTAEEVLAAIDEGWHLSIEDAIAALDAGEVIDEVAEAKAVLADIDGDLRKAVLADIEGDLRAALEAEAKALKVSFNARTSDKVLAERIAAAR